jgi:hypothetical protein
VGGESLIRAVIEVPSQQDGDLGRFEHRRPITPGRGDDARDLCDSLASKQQRLLHQTDKQLLRLFRRVRDGLVDAGLHKTARRIERRGRKGVVDDP